MNTREISELRRHIRRDRSNMTAIYGCYVNDKKEIVSQFRQSTAMMSENEAERYFGILKRSLSGSIGKNLIDINFKTSQVAAGEEHRLLMELRKSRLADERILSDFYSKVIDSIDLDGSFLILIGCDHYDVPFRSNDGNLDSSKADESFSFLLCAICPVKLTKPTLHYTPEDKNFHDGGIINVVAAPEIGFLFPAFDQRSTNIYNALYYTHSSKENHKSFVDAIFSTEIPQPAEAQKKSFEAILCSSLEKECTMDVVQTVHEEINQRIELHKQSREPEPLLLSKDEVKQTLSSCGVSEAHIAKFGIAYDEAFGFETQLHPKNVVNNRLFEIKTPDVSIKVAPDRSDLIETRVIGGVKYILICAEEDVEVNGVSIHIEEKEAALV